MSEMAERIGRAVLAELGIEHGSVLPRDVGIAALTAMREPTGEMWSAGRARFGAEAEKYRTQTTTVMANAYADKSPTLIYTAMIEAALK